MNSGGNPYYYLYDNLGSVVNLTSSIGAAEWTYSYEPFGAARSTTKNDPNAPDNPMQFAGEPLDSDGLYYMAAREQDPTTGRFLQIDPVTPPLTSPAMGSYVYADDLPTVLTDPTGDGPGTPEENEDGLGEPSFAEILREGRTLEGRADLFLKDASSRPEEFEGAKYDTVVRFLREWAREANEKIRRWEVFNKNWKTDEEGLFREVKGGNMTGRNIRVMKGSPLGRDDLHQGPRLYASDGLRKSGPVRLKP